MPTNWSKMNATSLTRKKVDFLAHVFIEYRTLLSLPGESFFEASEWTGNCLLLSKIETELHLLRL